MKYIILFFILIILVFTVNYKKETFLNFEQGTLKKKPFKFNSRKIVDSIDEGILFNLRAEKNLNSFSEELDFNQMNSILEELLKKNKHNLNFVNIPDDDYKKISNKLIDLINKTFTRLDLNHIYHKDDEREYKFKQYQVLKDTELSNLNRNLVINVEFLKDFKDYSFVIQFDIIYNKVKKYIEVKQAKIIGFKSLDKNVFDNLNWNQKNCNLEDYEKYEKDPGSYKTKLQQCHKESILTKEEMEKFFKSIKDGDEIGLSQTELNFFKEKEEQKKREKDNKKYRCFYKEGFNESTCRSYSHIRKLTGTWDKPCEKNEECPFFKKNKNYENSKGGCLGGRCEMPLNIQRRGFKLFNKKKKAFCHNCNIKDCLGDDCYTCCDEQKNRKKYPNLKSPDYMFFNDYSDRK
jgi:hypothetical protein